VQVQAPPGSITPNTWHHAALVVDPGAGTLSLYVDGMLVDGDSFSGPPHDGDGPLLIGWTVDPTGMGSGHLGLVRSARLSDAPIYTEEFVPAQSLSPGPDTRGLWSLQTGTGTFALDSSGMKNHGVIVGAEWVELLN
jgi:hypothetical protein